MITILNGKLTIPESERFIGFAGDNLARKIEFLLSGLNEADRIYRLYLTFDDGTVNHFVLPCAVTKEGVLLTWNVKKEHIFKSGNVRVQIKAFSQTGIVYHTRPDTLIVGNSAEFSDNLSVENSEFLEYEEMLNNLKAEVSEICAMTPYIGDNGNWYIYQDGEYIDSGHPSFADVPAVTVDQSFDPKSENPQSGKAVAEAVADIVAGEMEEIVVDQSFDPQSENPQSGKAVAEAVADIAAGDNSNCWKRKQVTIGSYLDLDTLIRTGSSDFDIFVITLNPTPEMYHDDGVRISPGSNLISYIDGLHNGNLYMMDMGTGEWWQYKCGSNLIKRVNTPVIDMGWISKPEDLSSKHFADCQSYIIHFTGDVEIGDFLCTCHRGTNTGPDSSGNVVTTEYGYLQGVSLKDGLAYRFDLLQNGAMSCTSPYTGQLAEVDQSYNPASENPQSGKAVAQAIEGVEQDFVCLPTVDNLEEFEAFTFESGKLYFYYVSGEVSSLFPSGRYLIRKAVIGYDPAADENIHGLELCPFIQNGKYYIYNLVTKEVSTNYFDVTLKDSGEYFVSDTVEGALQEIGAELQGVAVLLSQI